MSTEIFEKIAYYITLPELQYSLFPLKVIFLIFSLFFLVAIIYFLLRTTCLKSYFLQDLVEFLSYKPAGPKEIEKKWLKIKKKINTNLEPDFKLAIIEADNLLNNTLAKFGYEGKNLKERLSRTTKTVLPNLDEILEAHKIRNDIVHDPDYFLNLERTKKILEIYEQCFKNFGFL